MSMKKHVINTQRGVKRGGRYMESKKNGESALERITNKRKGLAPS